MRQPGSPCAAKAGMAVHRDLAPLHVCDMRHHLHMQAFMLQHASLTLDCACLATTQVFIIEHLIAGQAPCTLLNSGIPGNHGLHLAWPEPHNSPDAFVPPATRNVKITCRRLRWKLSPLLRTCVQ